MCVDMGVCVSYSHRVGGLSGPKGLECEIYCFLGLQPCPIKYIDVLESKP